MATLQKYNNNLRSQAFKDGIYTGLRVIEDANRMAELFRQPVTFKLVLCHMFDQPRSLEVTELCDGTRTRQLVLGIRCDSELAPEIVCIAPVSVVAERLMPTLRRARDSLQKRSSQSKGDTFCTEKTVRKPLSQHSRKTWNLLRRHSLVGRLLSILLMRLCDFRSNR